MVITQFVTIVTADISAVPDQTMRLMPAHTVFRPFSEIFEKDGRWIMGPGLLGDIVASLSGENGSLVANFSGSSVSIGFPLPYVVNEIDSNLYTIDAMIPEELRVIFYGRVAAITARRSVAVLERLDQHLNRPITPQTKIAIMAELRRIEREAMVRRWPTLADIAREEFGLSPAPFTLSRAYMAVDGNGDKIP